MKFFLCLLVIIPNLLFSEYDLAICAIFRNEVKYLAEWIDFHLEQGVEHFYLYDNLSTEDYSNILEPYIDAGIVDVIKYPYDFTKWSEWSRIQLSAYLDGIKRFKEIYKWVAFIDTDEFLFSPTFEKLPTILERFSDYPGVGVNWVLYGTSDVPFLPEGERLVDYLVMRSEIDFPVNKHVKSIVQPSLVSGCVSPHYFLYKRSSAVLEDFTPFNSAFSPKVSVNLLRINHYWSRDKEFFQEVKLKRLRKKVPSLEPFIELEKQLNAVYDPILCESD